MERLARRAPGGERGENGRDRAVSAETLYRATVRDARRRDDGYWRADDDLRGWARLMGEEDDDTDGATATTGGGGRRSAYRRGDARPWELARWRREDEKNAARIDSTHRRSSYGDDGGLNDALDASATGFARVGIPAHLADAARSAGLRRTTEIQRLATPPLMEGKNVAILAETGSGKTFAYLLPTMASVSAPGRKGSKRSGRCCPACVVLVPSVELGRQVTHAAELAAFWCTMSDEAIKSGYYTPNVFALLGKEKKLVRPAPKGVKKTSSKTKGMKKSASATTANKSKLQGDEEAIPEFRNADVLVCTPARLLKLIKDEWVLLGRLRHVVVDEADEMLSSGFASDVGEIIKLSYGENGINRFDTKVQYIFAAATMREAQPLLETFPGEVEWVSTARFGRVHPQLDVRVDDVRGDDAKFESLCDALNRHKAYKTLIFANSPEDADELVGKLDARDVVALAFHGRAKERGVVLDDFIAGDLKVCVCTDLAARGIDFPDLHHVAQYGAAPSMEMFLHRCGRTARTGQRGPFHVTCVVDLDAETVDEDVRSELESHQ